MTGDRGSVADGAIERPVCGIDRPEDELLPACYAEALRLAEEPEMRAVAFPAISTGAFGYPMADAARVALEAIASPAPSLRSVRRIRFVLYDHEAPRGSCPGSCGAHGWSTICGILAVTPHRNHGP